MLYHLLYPLSKYFFAFNLFRYITFRAAYATLTALVVSFALGAPLIRRLKRMKVMEKVREDGPSTHLVKEGTPTMGGILILISLLLPTVLWADMRNRYVQLSLCATVWMGLIGFVDDYLKAIKHIPKGLVGRYKLLGQTILGLTIGSILYFSPLSSNHTTITSVPFFKNVVIDFGWSYIPFVAIVLVGASNAINLTDGLDGLAIGLVGICALAFAALSYIAGRVDFSNYLQILYLPGSGELTVFLASVLGAALGFLWFNTHPAQVFMGDTGALALGGALGSVAVLIKKEFLLAIMGGVFVAEAASVIIQVLSFKLRRKRVFKMAPLHHHFELMGWKEPKVVVRLWIVAIMLALLSLSTLKIR